MHCGVSKVCKLSERTVESAAAVRGHRMCNAADGVLGVCWAGAQCAVHELMLVVHGWCEGQVPCGVLAQIRSLSLRESGLLVSWAPHSDRVQGPASHLGSAIGLGLAVGCWCCSLLGLVVITV